tara:strand:- start:6329 stop:7432 length:1104 start_codon:yes stop_codon:yes gene_type:complete
MKEGTDLNGIESIIRGEMEIKNDLICHSPEIEFSVTPTEREIEEQFPRVGQPTIKVDNQEYKASDLMMSQISAKLQVPNKYLKRMVVEAPELAETNINHWLQNQPKPFMVRTLGDTARAFLSDKYEIIDNWDVLTAVLPALKPYKDRDDLQFEQSHVTDSHLYLRLIVPSMERDVGVKREVGDIIQYGLQIKNSEVGQGSVEVSPFIKRLVCLNGMVADRFGHKKRHLGKSHWDGVDRSILRQETIRQGNKAWIMTVQDEVDNLFNGQTFEQITDEFILAQETQPIEKPVKAIEYVTKNYDFMDFEGESILENLLRDGDKTKYGLANAITRSATNSNTADRSMELESKGYEFLTMNDREWSNIATAS